MERLLFSYAQSFETSGQLGKTNWDAVIRVYDEVGNVIETHEQAEISKSPIGRPSNREECSLRFETPDNTGKQQRGVLGGKPLICELTAGRRVA